MQMPPAKTPLALRLARWMVPFAVIIVTIVWFWISPPGLLGKADAVGYAVCHRIDERSFHVDGRQLPLCARCSGMYLGAVLGLAIQAWIRPRRGGMPIRNVAAALVVFFIAFGIDGANSYLYLLKQTSPGFLPQIPNIYVPNNTLRLLTGTGMGLALAGILYPGFNQTIWKDWSPRSALDDWKVFGIMLALAAGMDWLVLAVESPFILLPVAYISAGGVLLLLTMVYAMAWVMLMQQDNQFATLRQTWLPILAGLTIALIQVTGIDLVRLALTHTWTGFPLQ